MRPVWSWSSLVFVLVVAAASGACAAEADVPVARASAPIINGSPLAGDLAVVALVDSDEARTDSIQCTGTLISSHVVLAAAHCLDFQGLPAPAFVFFGDDPSQGGDFRKVKKWR